MFPSNFTNLLLALQYRKTYQRALSMAREKFNIKQSNIEDLNPFKTLELYKVVVKKFYMSRTEIIEGSWFQNELRIYLWLLIGYLFIHKKTIQQMQTEDWSYFVPIFHNRPEISFQYQALCLIPQSRSSKWTAPEIQLLQSIIKQKQYKNKWNSTARQLFIRSQKKFYRSSKQCRQRWLNYLDPNKKKSCWDLSEDLLLLKTILQHGNRWSVAVKALNDTRTQHMVKNRYKSLIANETRYGKQLQVDIVKRMIEKLQKQISIKNKVSQVNFGTKLNTKSSMHENMSNNDPFYFYQPSNPNNPTNSPFSNPHPYPHYKKSSSALFTQLHHDQQNEFLMSNEEIQNFMLLDIQKQNKSHQMEQQQQVDRDLQQNQFCENRQKNNYFFQQYNPCFP